MITEFGGYPNTKCLNMLDELLKYMEANDVWIGWTAWSAGPLWGPNSPCCSSGNKSGSLEPGSLTDTGAPGMYDTVWKTAIQPHVPKSLKRNGISSVWG